MARRRQRMAQRADDQATHQAGIAETHLGLGRVDIHIDQMGGQVDIQRDDGMAVAGEEILVGAPDRAVHLYREVVERIRSSDTDVVINLTAGMGGDIVFGPADAPLPLSEQGTDMVSAAERVAHLEACLPEIATLDCGTMNFAEADYVMTNTPGMLREMASRMADLGIRIEIEAFDTGHLWLAQQLVSRCNVQHGAKPIPGKE